jgi:hypothetical protein
MATAKERSQPSRDPKGSGVPIQRRIPMLGEKIAEGRGKRIYRRILPSSGGQLRAEVTGEDAGKVLGVDYNGNLTYTAETTPQGTLFGEGNGVYITADGELVTWTGQGRGILKPGGAVSYRGAIYYTTASAKLARLNSVAGVFEFEVDGEGNTHGQVWEWK